MKHKKRTLPPLLAIYGTVIALALACSAIRWPNLGTDAAAAQEGTTTVTPPTTETGTRTALPSPTETLTATPTPTPTPTPIPESDLEDTGLPPEGVAALLNFFTPFTGCRPSTTQPAIRTGSSEWEIAQENMVCLYGFRAEPPVTVYELRPPDRAGHQIWRRRQEAATLSGSQWVYLPDAPTGEYILLAVQGSRQAWTTFTLHGATQPHLTVLDKDIRPGQEVRIAWAGYGETKQLYVYRFDNATTPAVYIEALPLPAIEADSAGVYTMRISAGTEPGTYIVHTGEPRSFIWPTSASFEVSLPQRGPRFERPGTQPPARQPGEIQGFR